VRDRGFKEKGEHELAAMPEHELIAYVLAARAAGTSTRVAVSILVFALMRDVRRRVAMKVPDEAIEEVSEAVLLSALTSRFDGSSVGEFRSWLRTIIQRRIADYHRSPKTDVRLVPLPDEHEGDDEVWGNRVSVPFEGEAIDVERALDQAYGELNPDHCQVVDLYIFDDLPAGEVAGRVDGISETNVHKIAQRFRDRVSQLLPDQGHTSQ
jgi:RNA polymerase sigma factor (sigma-70 family)